MLMEKSRTIYSPEGLRRLTFETVIGFMTVTEARTSEVVDLKITDVVNVKEENHYTTHKLNREQIEPLMPWNVKVADLQVVSDEINPFFQAIKPVETN